MQINCPENGFLNVQIQYVVGCSMKWCDLYGEPFASKNQNYNYTYSLTQKVLFWEFVLQIYRMYPSDLYSIYIYAK